MNVTNFVNDADRLSSILMVLLIIVARSVGGVLIIRILFAVDIHTKVEASWIKPPKGLFLCTPLVLNSRNICAMLQPMTRQERWKAALAERNDKRIEQRHRLQGREPITTPAYRTVPQPHGDMMVRRGITPVALSHKQASRTTAKSWKTRKEQFGKAGRAAKITFRKK